MRKQNDNAQMLVIEAIIMATIVLMALVFLYQLSTPATIPVETEQLNIQAENALEILNTQTISTLEHSYYNYPEGYMPSRLAHLLYINDTAGLTTQLNSLLPSNTDYQIYLANQSSITLLTKKTQDTPMPPEIKTSSTLLLPIHHQIAMQQNTDSAQMGINSIQNTYDFILEVWYI